MKIGDLSKQYIESLIDIDFEPSLWTFKYGKMEQAKFKKICGYCDKTLPKDGICKEGGCMYRGGKQLNPEPRKEEPK